MYANIFTAIGTPQLLDGARRSISIWNYPEQRNQQYASTQNVMLTFITTSSWPAYSNRLKIHCWYNMNSSGDSSWPNLNWCFYTFCKLKYPEPNLESAYLWPNIRLYWRYQSRFRSFASLSKSIYYGTSSDHVLSMLAMKRCFWSAHQIDLPVASQIVRVCWLPFITEAAHRKAKLGLMFSWI